MLLRRGAEAGARDAAGATPLHLVGEQRQEFGWRSALGDDARRICAMLVTHGAGTDARDSSGATPLLVQSGRVYPGSAAVLRFLLDSGSAASIEDDAGNGALHRLCRVMSTGVPDTTRAFTSRPIEEAVALHEELLDLMVTAGVEPNSHNMSRRTPLHELCRSIPKELSSPRLPPVEWVAAWREKLARRLVGHGARVDVQDLEGNTPLHFAALTGDERLYRALVALGADVRTANSAEETPEQLLTSVLRGHEPLPDDDPDD